MEDETVDHVIQCQHKDAALLWDTGIEEIYDWVDDHNEIAGLSLVLAQRLQ